jgi:hypothetical protein
MSNSTGRNASLKKGKSKVMDGYEKLIRESAKVVSHMDP